MSITGIPAAIILTTGSVIVLMSTAWMATKSHFSDAISSANASYFEYWGRLFNVDVTWFDPELSARAVGAQNETAPRVAAVGINRVCRAESETLGGVNLLAGAQQGASAGHSRRRLRAAFSNIGLQVSWCAQGKEAAARFVG